MPEPAILVLDDANRLVEIVTHHEVEDARVEHLEGILTPGFVNSHCHLELSHLKGHIPKLTGLPEFAKHVILLRNKISLEEKMEHMRQAELEMWNNGTVAVGDISNGPESFELKAGSKLFYHTFIELIGLQPKNAEALFENGLNLFRQLEPQQLAGSLAPHASYSTSKELIQKIARYNQTHQLSFSIHNQESDEETKFLQGEKNEFEALYQFLGLDTTWFSPSGLSSLKYYSDVLASNAPSLLVHNTVTKAADVAVTLEKAVYWCFCPEANLYIEGRLPDLQLFKGLEQRICIGTDSLASNSHLDLIQEANNLLIAGAPFSLETLLRAITWNGAEALGISDHFGRLCPGKNVGLNWIDFKDSQLHFIKKIT